MDLIASFHSHKIKQFHFFSISGLNESKSLFFLFDTGAVCPVVGINNFFPDSDEPDAAEKKVLFENLVREEILSQNILPRPRALKAANNQEVHTYPCVCGNVSISNIKKMDFYFDISFEEISIPLLGSSFIDDCSFTHSMGSSLNITGIHEKAGSDFYTGINILDFNKVIERFTTAEPQ